MWIDVENILSICLGVARRTLQVKIIHDYLEEATETFEVLLASPEGTVIGNINKAQVSIRETDSKMKGEYGYGV